jgi:hypothetical protein
MCLDDVGPSLFEIKQAQNKKAPIWGFSTLF